MISIVNKVLCFLVLKYNCQYNKKIYYVKWEVTPVSKILIIYFAIIFETGYKDGIKKYKI